MGRGKRPQSLPRAGITRRDPVAPGVVRSLHSSRSMATETSVNDLVHRFATKRLRTDPGDMQLFQPRPGSRAVPRGPVQWGAPAIPPIPQVAVMPSVAVAPGPTRHPLAPPRGRGAQILFGMVLVAGLGGYLAMHFGGKPSAAAVSAATTPPPASDPSPAAAAAVTPSADEATADKPSAEPQAAPAATDTQAAADAPAAAAATTDTTPPAAADAPAAAPEVAAAASPSTKPARAKHHGRTKAKRVGAKTKAKKAKTQRAKREVARVVDDDEEPAPATTHAAPARPSRPSGPTKQADDNEDPL
jgi:hypothetical protein